MPRYLFAWDDQTPPSEQLGEELPTDDAARRFALIIADQINRSAMGHPKIAVFKVNGRRPPGWDA